MQLRKSHYLALLLVATVAFTGCGGKKNVTEEDADGISNADTAMIEAVGDTDAIPVIEGSESAKTASAEEPVSLDGGKGSNEIAAASEDTPTISNPESSPSVGKSSHAEQRHHSVVGSGEMASYKVKSGDTLMKIAFELYGDITRWKDVYEWNKSTLSNANVVRVGMNLQYDKPSSEPNISKNGDPYLIKNGDTLGKIADDVYAKKSYWRKLYENNRDLIRDPNKIYAGFYLYYQISETEKQEAERIKASRNGGTPLGKAPDAEPQDHAAAGAAATGVIGVNPSVRAPASVKK